MPQLVALYARSFKSSWEESFFRQILDSSGGIGIGAFDHDQRLLGFCLARYVLDEAEILTIVVDDAKRKQGIGFCLLSRIIEQLKLFNIEKIYLEAHEENQSALSLYKRMCFQPVGIRRQYYIDTEEMPGNALVLELVLNK